MKTLEKTLIKRTSHLMTFQSKHKRVKKVWDVLKTLWFDKIWNWKSDLSVNHDNILYK